MNLHILKSCVAVAFAATATLALPSCSEDKDNSWDEFYKPDPSTPGPSTPTPIEGKPAFIWVDAAGNFPALANSKENIDSYIEKARANGFTDIVVDVRPTNGDVLFKTELAKQVDELYTWTGGTYGPTRRTATWDYLREFIDAGHRAGVRVHAAMNTMVGGNMPSGTQGMGMLFRDSSKRDWATTLNLPASDGGLKNAMDYNPSSGETTKFLNPHHPEVQDFIVGLVEDLARYDGLDGIILDRCRFLDMRSDFSPLTRTKFESYAKTTVNNWPADILPVGATTPSSESSQLCKKWWEFRAMAMHDLVERCSKAAKAVNPAVKFGCYVGAWYSTYYQSGVNWASPTFDPTHNTSYHKWASNDYMKAGYADHIDILILGCYAKPWSVYGSNEWTVQGFAKKGYELAGGTCPVVVGGPDIGNNWPTASRDYVFASDPQHSSLTADDYMESAAASVDVCMQATDGYFLFDICHLYSSPRYWDALKAGIERNR